MGRAYKPKGRLYTQLSIEAAINKVRTGASTSATTKNTICQHIYLDRE